MKNSTFICLGLTLLSFLFRYVDASSCTSSCSCDKDDSSENHWQTEKRAIRQCTYKNLSDGKDEGEIMTCNFRKSHKDTALRVTYHGDMRVISASSACRRWFITINDSECTSPATIEAAVNPYGVTGLNNHRPGSLDGFCENIPKGPVTVGLSVGKCKYGQEKAPGDAYTCWGVCRLIIEEVPPLQ